CFPAQRNDHLAGHSRVHNLVLFDVVKELRGVIVGMAYILTDVWSLNSLCRRTHALHLAPKPYRMSKPQVGAYRIRVGDQSRLEHHQFRTASSTAYIQRQAMVAPQGICLDYRCPGRSWARPPPTGNRLPRLDVSTCAFATDFPVAHLRL